MISEIANKLELRVSDQSLLNLGLIETSPSHPQTPFNLLQVISYPWNKYQRLPTIVQQIRLI